MNTTSITTTKTCGKCKEAPAVLTLANNTDSQWHYCTNCAKRSLHSTGPDYDGGPLGQVVRYVYPFDRFTPRADLPADALALCRS